MEHRHLPPLHRCQDPIRTPGLEACRRTGLDVRVINPTAVLGGGLFDRHPAWTSSKTPSLATTPSHPNFPCPWFTSEMLLEPTDEPSKWMKRRALHPRPPRQPYAGYDLQAHPHAQSDHQSPEVQPAQHPRSTGRVSRLVGRSIWASTLPTRRGQEHDGRRHQLLKCQSREGPRHDMGGF